MYPEDDTHVRVRYQTIQVGPYDVHLRTLFDRNQYADPDGTAEAAGISSAAWPLFGLVWDAARVLAEHVVDLPIDGLRFLEVGCGIALPSLVLNQRGADVMATDLHPEARNFLAHNDTLNPGPPIPFVQADWADDNLKLGEFDRILASDVLYERVHVKLLADFVERHLAPEGQMILTDPGRGHATRFLKELDSRGFRHTVEHPEGPEGLREEWNGRVITFQR